MTVVKKKSTLNSRAFLGGENGGPLNQSKWSTMMVPYGTINVMVARNEVEVGGDGVDGRGSDGDGGRREPFRIHPD